MSDLYINLQSIQALYDAEIERLAVQSGKTLLEQKKEDKNHVLGWVDTPISMQEEDFLRIERAASTFSGCDFVICIGIGGSYLGGRAVIQALGHSFESYRTTHKHPQVLFAGQNICQDYLYELMMLLQDRSFGIIHISKSGTTTEPAIAFRFLRDLLIGKVGEKEADRLTVVITSPFSGALRTLANQKKLTALDIPDNVGGRFSVLTAVGLLPMAISRIDIRQLLNGAKRMREQCLSVAFDKNPAMRFAAARYALYMSGKKIEILATSTPKLHFFSEWWKQLFAESEGKQQRGLFPAAITLTTDLHSMGQWIQQGERSIFETYVTVDKCRNNLTLPLYAEDTDQLNYIAGYSPNEINRQALIGSQMAHTEGEVPILEVSVPELNAYCMGQLLYFFEFVVAIGGLMLKVNPFDQPGVEAYKVNTFRLLKRPGY